MLGYFLQFFNTFREEDIKQLTDHFLLSATITENKKIFSFRFYLIHNEINTSLSDQCYLRIFKLIIIKVAEHVTCIYRLN